MFSMIITVLTQSQRVGLLWEQEQAEGDPCAGCALTNRYSHRWAGQGAANQVHWEPQAGPGPCWGSHQEQEKKGQTQVWRWGCLQPQANIQPGNGAEARLKAYMPTAWLRLRPGLLPKIKSLIDKPSVQSRGLRCQFIYNLNLIHLLAF